MTYREILDAKTPNTNYRAVFDFLEYLAVGTTLSSAVTTAVVYSGTDASPSAIISGAASIASPKATQTITGGVEGVVYFLTCVGTRSDAVVMVRTAFLAVKTAMV